MLSFFTIVFLIIYTITLWFIIQNKKISQQDELIDISRYEINTRTPFDSNALSILDEFINDCFTDYQVMVLFPKNELYITAEREEEIINDLAAKVSERLSPNFKDKLYQYYNPETIDKVIADKIYITVLNYSLGINSVSTKNIIDETKNKG